MLATLAQRGHPDLTLEENIELVIYLKTEITVALYRANLNPWADKVLNEDWLPPVIEWLCRHRPAEALVALERLRTALDESEPPAERKERLRQAVLELPAEISSYEAAELLRAGGWKISASTVQRLRRAA
jgi:hypothetical protein